MLKKAVLGFFIYKILRYFKSLDSKEIAEHPSLIFVSSLIPETKKNYICGS